jgi:putative endonuclease
MNKFFVYIISNSKRTLYTGITNDLIRRITEHKKGTGSKFSTKHKLNTLVYFEEGDNINEAIYREKQIKGWLRSKKISLIEEANPNWEDLSKAWFEWFIDFNGTPDLLSGWGAMRTLSLDYRKSFDIGRMLRFAQYDKLW